MMLKLLWASLRDQPLQFLLAALLCSLGMTAVVSVIALQDTLESHGARQAEGIDLVVGAKGSALQNTLAAVYHLDVPNGNIRLADVELLGKHPMVAQAVPISLGDSVGGVRIVGAPNAFYSLYGATLASGAWPAAPLEAAVGANAAKRLKLRLGDQFVGSHGIGETSLGHSEHPFLVTAIIAPTGRVIDNLVVTPLESVWTVHAEHSAPDSPPEVTFALIKLKSLAAIASLPRYINAETNLQATSPAAESARLLANFQWVALIVKVFAGALIVATGIALLAALLQSLDRRQTDLALLRAMGVRAYVLRWLLVGQGALTVLAAAALAAVLVGIALFWLERFGLPGVTVNRAFVAGVALLVTLAAMLLALLATIPVLSRTAKLELATLLSKS